MWENALAKQDYISYPSEWELEGVPMNVIGKASQLKNEPLYLYVIGPHNDVMTARRKITSRPRTVAAGALGLALVIAVVLCVFWFGRDWWKVLIGWRALVGYIDPQQATDRKDAVQVYAVIVAGVVAAITATVGLLNLRLTRRNLEQ